MLRKCLLNSEWSACRKDNECTLYWATILPDSMFEGGRLRIHCSNPVSLGCPACAVYRSLGIAFVFHLLGDGIVWMQISPVLFRHNSPGIMQYFSLAILLGCLVRGHFGSRLFSLFSFACTQRRGGEGEQEGIAHSSTQVPT